MGLYVHPRVNLYSELLRVCNDHLRLAYLGDVWYFPVLSLSLEDAFGAPFVELHAFYTRHRQHHQHINIQSGPNTASILRVDNFASSNDWLISATCISKYAHLQATCFFQPLTLENRGATGVTLRRWTF